MRDSDVTSVFVSVKIRMSELSRKSFCSKKSSFETRPHTFKLEIVIPLHKKWPVLELVVGIKKSSALTLTLTLPFFS